MLNSWPGPQGEVGGGPYHVYHFQRFQSMFFWPSCFGPVAAQDIFGGVYGRGGLFTS
jgi:hypothetical protein